MEIKFIKILEVFDEFFYPTFYSYIAQINGKERKMLTTFAYYDEENKIDYFYNTEVSKEDYNKLLKGKLEIRHIFRKSEIENFFTNNSPENLEIIKPVVLNVELEKVLPDSGLYISEVDGEYSVIDFEELKEDFELDAVNLDSEIFEIKPKIKEQIDELVESGASNNGVVITFENDTNNFVLNVIGKLMTKSGDLFRKISNSSLNLEVLKPFESSFGISMNISNDGKLNIDDGIVEINKFIMLLKMVADKKLFNEELIALYQKSERKDLSSLLELMANNDIEMTTAYFKYDKKGREFSTLQTNRITVENAKEFIKKTSIEKIRKEKFKIKKANLYKIDLQKNLFGLINSETDEKVGGTINVNISEDEVFNVPSIVEATITKIIKKNEFTQSENIKYDLEAIKKTED